MEIGGTMSKIMKRVFVCAAFAMACVPVVGLRAQDRKSTRLNSSHQIISYAVFCLKKKQELPPRRLEGRPLDAPHPHPSLQAVRCLQSWPAGRLAHPAALGRVGLRAPAPPPRTTIA